MGNTSNRIKFFQDIALMVTQLSNEGIRFMPTCFYRSQSEQEEIVKRGVSKTLNSKHTKWLAMDFVLIKNDNLVWLNCSEYKRAGEIWEGLGNIWGGRWQSLNDIYHFEFKGK